MAFPLLGRPAKESAEKKTNLCATRSTDFNPSPAYLSPVREHEDDAVAGRISPGARSQRTHESKRPVAIVWGWQMAGCMLAERCGAYMQDINGTGEHFPPSAGSPCWRIRTGDGKMDKQSVFIDSLVLPPHDAAAGRPAGRERGPIRITFTVTATPTGTEKGRTRKKAGLS